jgi:uncharacterized membrane protein YhaH (DUF805 family)
VAFFQAIRAVIARCSDFAGIAKRPEFWWFALFVALGHLALNSLNIVTAAGTVYLGASLSGAFGIATLLPLVAASVRRLHDAGSSALELLWLLLPVAGLIVLIVRLSAPSRSPLPGSSTAMPPELSYPTAAA